MKKTVLILTSLIFVLEITSFAQSAEDILGKMDALMLAPKDKQSIFRMTLMDKNGRGMIKEAELFQKKTGERLTRYTKPENQAGISTLFLPDGTVWLYMPALGNPKKISGLANSQAFNNTDFAIEDMSSTPYLKRYSPELIQNSPANYILELTPREEETGYSKLVVTINKKFYYPEVIEYFDRTGKKSKEAVYEYEKVGSYWNARKIEMTDIKKEHSTTIESLSVQFDKGLPDSIFLVDNLRPPKEE